MGNSLAILDLFQSPLNLLPNVKLFHHVFNCRFVWKLLNRFHDGLFRRHFTPPQRF